MLLNESKHFRLLNKETPDHNPPLLPLISILVGLIFLVSFSLWLWYMLTRPNQWARFADSR